GKTSLLLKIIDEFTEAGIKSIRVDLGAVAMSIDAPRPTTEFVNAFADEVCAALGLEIECDSYFDECGDGLTGRRGHDHKFLLDFFLEVVVPHLDGKTYIFLDELDRARYYGNALEVLSRFLSELMSDPKFDNLRFILTGLSNITMLGVDDLAKFDRVLPIRIPDFDLSNETINGFSSGIDYVQADLANELCRTVLEYTSGQPLLTNILLREVQRDKIDTECGVRRLVAELVAMARGKKSSIRFQNDKNHFLEPWRVLEQEYPQQASQVLIAYGEALKNGQAQVLQDRPHAAMLATGLTVFDEKVGYTQRSKIYSKVLDNSWLNERLRDVLHNEADDGKQELRKKRPKKNDLPKVLVANVGGTLGMDVDQHGRLIEPEDPQKFFDSMKDLTDLIQPQVLTAIGRPTDGANITPKDWVSIAKMIYDHRAEGIAGAVIAMGTDTLAYAASAVAFALGDRLRFPVVFTGSQAPNNKPYADAKVNLLRAALVAREGEKLPEVVIAFNDEVIRAVRAEKVDDFRFKAFDAPTEGPLAIIGEALDYKLQPRRLGSLRGWDLEADFEERILKVALHPGLRPELLDLVIDQGDIRGLVIESLGLGNIPVVKGYDLLPSISKAIGKNIPVLISGRYPIMPVFMDNYAPASAPLKLKAISAGDMAPPAALTKFMWAIAQTDKAIRQKDTTEDQRISHIKKIMGESTLGEVTTTKPANRDEK
ncbi:asparaginase domain-containing protein, partial [uncultured Tateyamaria sp.]|uniref:asparaginase domain-containing protein n=1 Tax=uncultured Tateyamaria sp. TaxID=455651 RepID=UPI002628EEBF